VGIRVETRHLLGYANAYDHVYNKVSEEKGCRILHNAVIITELEKMCKCRVTKQCEAMLFLPTQMYHTISELEFHTKRDLTMFLLRWA